MPAEGARRPVFGALDEVEPFRVPTRPRTAARRLTGRLVRIKSLNGAARTAYRRASGGLHLGKHDRARPFPGEESELDNADEHEDDHDDHDHAHDSNATVSRIHFYPPFRTLIR
jgi:ABC-type Zn2+ transport system substrate-binding protein/surface adhesin